MIRFSIGLRVYTSEMPRRKHSYFGEVFCEGVLGRAKGVVGGFGLVAKDLPAGLRKKAGNGKGVRRLEKDWTKNIIEKAGPSNEWTNGRMNDRDRDRDRANETKRNERLASSPSSSGLAFCFVFFLLSSLLSRRSSLSIGTHLFIYTYIYIHTYTYRQASAYMAYIYVLISI